MGGDIRYHNANYDGGTPDLPLAVGDRFYGQDLFRNFRALQELMGIIYKNVFGADTDNWIIEGLEVTQGSGHTIDITVGKGLVAYQVKIPDPASAWGVPPTIITADVLLEVSHPGGTNIAITGANTDGMTENYVKLAYKESDGETRNRAKKSGSYAYEVYADYTLSVNDTPPTAYELVIATFTTNGTTITFTNNEDDRVEDKLKTIASNINTIIINVDNLIHPFFLSGGIS